MPHQRSPFARHARPVRRALGLAGLGLIAATPSTSAHVRWFVPDANAPIARAAVFSGVTVLALLAIGATIGAAWVAARLAARRPRRRRWSRRWRAARARSRR